ncbi:MAG: hypothetical protein AB1743_06360 [Actinomycetota bacterium]
MRLADRLRISLFVILLILPILTTGCMSSSREVAVKTGVEPVQETGGVTRLGQELSSNNAQSSSSNKGLTITVNAGINGITKQGGWMPVAVTIENKGDPIKGYITVRPLTHGITSHLYQQKVDLGHQTRKRLLFNTQLNYFGNSRIEAAFISNDEVLVKAVASYLEIPPNHKIIIALLDQDSNRQFFKDIASDQTNLKISYMEPQDLPFRDGSLSTVSSIVISGVSTSSLTKEQRSAILNWVASGGHLTVCGGSDWRKSTSGLPEEILPIKLSGIEVINRPISIEHLTGKIGDIDNEASMPVPLALASRNTGKVTASSGDVPLIITRNFGLGKVDWVALDLTVEPFTSWRDNSKFWNHLSQTPIEQEAQGVAHFDSFGNIGGAISSIPAMDLPSLSWLIPYLMLYIILIGPINYFILKRKGRKELLLVTIPAIILIFSLSSFTYAYGKKGGEIIVNQIDIIERFPDTGISKARSLFGVFSPSKRTYDISLPSNSSVTGMPVPGPLTPDNPSGRTLIIEDGSRPMVKRMSLGMWSMRNLQMERYAETSPNLYGAVTFHENELIISLDNRSKDEFNNVAVIVGGSAWDIGKIQPAKTLRITRNLKSRTIINPMQSSLGYRIYEPKMQPGNRERRDETIMAETINHIFGYQGEKLPKTPVLIAWLDKPSERIGVIGEHPRVAGKTVLISPLEVRFGDILTVPLGILNRRLISSTGSFGLDPSGFFIGNGAVTLEYSLPPNDRKFRADKLSLYISAFSEASGRLANDFTVEIYSWRAKSWHNLGPIPGPSKSVGSDNISPQKQIPAGIDLSSSSILIDGAESFVNDDGRILVRISSPLSGVRVNTLDFEVTGKWQ